MQTTIKFGGQDQEFNLTSAILLYSEKNDRSLNAATVHNIEFRNQRPFIAPGEPITIQSLEQMMAGLGRQTGGHFIPETVLSLGLDSMVWWCPGGRRRIWFKPSHEDKDAKALNGKFVHHPPLLFVAKNHGLNAFALLEDKRPTPKTQLYRAPYWNLSEGHMCNGNLQLPPVSADNISGFEKAFFNSAFTHSSAGTLTSHPKGHTGLWSELSLRKTKPDAAFWNKNLINTKKTVTAILK